MSRPHHPGPGLDLGTRDVTTKIQPLSSWTYYSSEGAKRVKRQLHRQHLNREGSVRAQCEGTKGTERLGTRRKPLPRHPSAKDRPGKRGGAGAYVGANPCSLSTNNGQRLPVLRKNRGDLTTAPARLIRVDIPSGLWSLKCSPVAVYTDQISWMAALSWLHSVLIQFQPVPVQSDQTIWAEAKAILMGKSRQSQDVSINFVLPPQRGLGFELVLGSVQEGALSLSVVKWQNCFASL